MLGHRKLDVSEYTAILKRHWLLILIPAIIMPAIGFGLTFVLPPEYVSKTLVIIEPQRVAEQYVKPVVGNDLDQRLASMTEQILSRSSIQPIIDRYNLYSTQHLNSDEKIELARKKIKVEPIKSEISKLAGLPGFNITFKNGDAKTAQLVCADITSLFISQNIKQHEDAAQGTTEFLRGQLEDAKRNLDEHDAKLAEFQRQYVGKLPGEEGKNMGMLTSVNTQLEAVTENLAQMEQQKSYEEAMISQQSANAAVISANPGTPSPTVATTSAPTAPNPQQVQLQTLLAQETDLTSRYTGDHPDVVAIRHKIDELRKEIAKNPAPGAITPAAIRSRRAALPSRSTSRRCRASSTPLRWPSTRRSASRPSSRSLSETIRSRISASPLVEEQYKELTRDYQTAQAFYNNLLGEMNHAKMATALETRQEGEQFAIKDQANLPDSPTFPNPIIFSAGGLVVGLIIGLGIVVILEYKDTALSTERDIWEFTRLPTLAVIAFIPRDEPVQVPKRSFFARLNPFSRKAPVTQS